ncbi:type IV secretory system conjugative DNA transfer family protein [Bartonella sp. AR 15-3]|nr:type IV secretory system conjugative DNA transfer family protein [Bartonella sp. AR 15-3]
MFFFAGSGGYKTTSNVIPARLKYSDPIVVLIQQQK